MDDYIGALVKQFESGTKGSLSFSNCGNDMGLSCGSYQLTLAYGNCINFLKKYFPNESAKLYYRKYLKTNKYPGAEYCSNPNDVKTVWTKCYNKVGATKFFEYEHAHIKQTYYDKICAKLKGICEPDKHSRMLQECLWSWSVHRGVTGCYNEFIEATKYTNIMECPADELIDRLYDTRYKYFRRNRYAKGFSPNISEREKLRLDAMKGALGTNLYVESNKVSEKGDKQATIGYIKTKCELNIRSAPSWHDSVVYSVSRKGVIYTCVDKIKVGNSYMYKLKSGFYISASDKYVTFSKNINELK